MNQPTYIVGEKFSGGYPSGRYVCTLVTGPVYDNYIVTAVLDYPSIRAVANNEAWSNAKVKKYGDLFYFRREEGYKRPEVYNGNLGTSDRDYQLSLIDAIERAIEGYEAKGDAEAVGKLREKLQAAVEVAEIRKVGY